MTNFSILLFDKFETLDAFGPAEIIGNLAENFCLDYFSLNGGIVTSSHGVRVSTKPFSEITKDGIILVPGGMGTRTLVDDYSYISQIKELSDNAQYVLSVCTGSALLAKTGILDNKSATSNKLVFNWVTSLNSNVIWIKQARWVVDGKYYTSSGVSAGMDMTLGFISDTLGEQTAMKTANLIEYTWNSDKSNDPFASLY